MRLPRTFLIVGFVSLVAIAGCGDDDVTSGSGTTEPRTSTTSELDGTYGTTTVTGHDLVPGSAVELTFDDGALTAQAGCNTLGGSYRVTGDTLRVAGDMQSTLMACPPGYAEQDQWLTEFLTSGPTISLDGTTLTLTSGGVTMVLSAAPTGAAALEGTKWTLDTINEGSTASALPAGVETPTLEFDAAGTRRDCLHRVQSWRSRHEDHGLHHHLRAHDAHADGVSRRRLPGRIVGRRSTGRQGRPIASRGPRTAPRQG